MNRDSGRNSRRERDDRGDRGTGPDDGSSMVTRSIDGSGTNPDHPDRGAVGQTLLRLSPGELNSRVCTAASMLKSDMPCRSAS